MVTITEAVTLERAGAIGLLWIDNPPVNALGQAVRQGLAEGVALLEKNDGLEAMVVICRGRTFCAGADIREIGKKMLEPFLPEVLHAFDRCTKPIIAAIHGTALGGGLETALSCHYRIAVPTARLGLPEVKLGLLPGAGGTQRLPRLIGVEQALDMIISGEPIDAAAALKRGVIDEIAEGDLAEAAVVFARKIVAERRPLIQVSAMTEKIEAARRHPEIFEEYRQKMTHEARGYDAPQACISAVEAAVSLPFLEGCARERELFYELREGTQSAAQRYYFFAERTAAKVPGLPRDTPLLEIENMAVADELAGLNRETGLTLEKIGGAVCIMALDADQDVGEIVADSGRPESVAGMHFMGAAEKRRLVEVVRTPKTSASVLATALSLAKRMKTIAVVVGACQGLAANRMYAAFEREATRLLLEGALPDQIERVLYDFGFASGPFARFDRTIEACAEQKGCRHRKIGDEEILNRGLCAVINAGAELLEEGVVVRPSDIDVIWVNAFGWPVYWGGPMFYADHLGVDRVVKTMAGFQEASGSRMKPAPLLEKMAQEGSTFSSWRA